MNRINNKIKSIFAVFFIVAISMIAFCFQGAAADDDLRYTVGVGETVALDGFESVENCTYDPEFVSVSSDGATALSVGNTEVTYTDKAQNSHTVFLTIKKAPSSVKLNASAVTLGVGEAFDFVASFNKDEACENYRFSVNKKSVLFNTQNGSFVAKKSGSAIVSVTTYNGKKAVCKVTVKKAPTSVKLNAAAVALGVGESVNFNTRFNKGEVCRRYKYSTDRPDILVYSKNGIFTAKKTGSATVSVTTFNGKKAFCKVTVKKAPTSVKLNAAKVTLGVGESVNFNTRFNKGEVCRHHKYSTDRPDILTYSKNGIFTAKKKGSATVSVTTFNGKKATCKVTVYPLPKSIASEESFYSISIGKIKTAKIVFPKGSFCKTYTYKSSDPTVISVNKKGKFQGLKVGSARITVKSKNGKTASFTVSVNPMNVSFVNQFPNYPTGCEAAAAVQLLRYYGYSVTLDQMVNAIPRENIVYKNGRRYGPDINKKFVGNPKGTYTSGNPGYGAFSPVVTKSLQKIINERKGKHTAVKLTGCTFSQMLNEISSGRPAIVWATYKMFNPTSVNSWYIPQANGSAKYFEYPRGTHVMVLTGHSDRYVWITDPILGKVSYDISIFEARWNLLGKQAIVLKKNKAR